MRLRLAAWLLVAAALPSPLAGRPSPSIANRHLIVVVDGLRPDLVTPAVMPNLTALGRRGVVFTRHHSVYPTVTRVNAASIATGAYPETHGLLGNFVYFAAIHPGRFLDTANREHLAQIARSEPRLLTAPTTGELLQAAGRSLLVVSSSSEGNTLVNNPTVAGGAILHAQFALPERLRGEMQVLGPPPPDIGAPPGSRDRYAVDALLKVGIPKIDPSVTVLWLDEYDRTAHDKGISAADTTAVLRNVDAELGRIEAGLRDAGLLDRYNIWVTSDHGFSTHAPMPDVTALLAPFTSTLPDGSPSLMSTAGVIYLRGEAAPKAPAIVMALQQTPGIGAIFTSAASAGSLDGRQAGTLSFDAVRWQHPRSGQILYSMDWTDDAGAGGVRGTAAAGSVAGHGSSSPWEIHNTLIAAGPDLKRGVINDAPSGNVDFAPTFLTLLGVRVPATMQGRVLEEALSSGRPIAAARRMEHTAVSSDRSYSVTGLFSSVTIGDRTYRYLDGTRVVRK